jgi:hypothetical protein
MKLFRHVLVAFLLLLAQSGALTHAVEHLRIDADTPASHSCSLCLVAQGLDAALASAPPDIALSTADFAPPAGAAFSAFSAPALAPRARAPPAA